jgi:hypothetical protein
MCRHKCAIRGVALFTQQVNFPKANKVHIFRYVNVRLIVVN